MHSSTREPTLRHLANKGIMGKPAPTPPPPFDARHAGGPLIILNADKKTILGSFARRRGSELPDDYRPRGDCGLRRPHVAEALSSSDADPVPESAESWLGACRSGYGYGCRFYLPAPYRDGLLNQCGPWLRLPMIFRPANILRVFRHVLG